MHAVILAGGQGTRLRPLTYARRKELVPLLDRPLLEYRLTNLRDHGLTDVALACSAGAKEIEQHFGDGVALGVRLTYHYEDRPLGSGRAVKEAALAAGASGAIVVCNGDIVTNVDLTAMLVKHRETGAAMSISLAPVDDPWSYGVVAVDENLRIGHFVEKPEQGTEPSNLINAGTWIWEPAVLERIPDDDSAVRDQFSERVLFPGLIADGLRLQGFVEDLWVDVGSPERYLRATRLLLERRFAPVSDGSTLLLGTGAAIGERSGTHGLVQLGDGVTVGSGTVIAGPASLGTATRVGNNVTLDASVTWDNVHIGNGAVVGHSIIAGGARVGANARIFDAVLADGAVVPDGCVPPPGLRLHPGETYSA